MAEAAETALGGFQLAHRAEDGMGHGFDDQLGDAVAPLHLVVVDGVCVDQEHPELVAVPRVDQAGGVEHGHPVAHGQATSRLDKAGKAWRDGQGQASRDHHPPTTRRDQDVLSGHEVSTSIALAGVGRQRQLRVEPYDLHFHTRRACPHALYAMGTGAAGEGSAPTAATDRPGPPGAPGKVRSVLVWMDLEMTGLDPARDLIVEVATLVTDDELAVVEEGPDLVIATPQPALDGMEEVVRLMHQRSGLLEAIGSSKVTLAEAAEQTLAFVRKHVPEPRKVPLCGNSIGTDRRFLAAYMPELEAYLHYRSVDVSTIKELARRWYPEAYAGAPKKAGAHRALDDIKESVEELKYWRSAIFIAKIL